MGRKQTQAAECRWSGELTVRRAAELRQELVQTLDAADRLLIDLSGATEVDASCLQLLCSGHRTATARNKAMALKGTEHLTPLLRDAGFLRHIGCALDCTGSCIWAPREPKGKEIA